MRYGLLLILAALLSACAGKPHCLHEEPYRSAQEFPPLAAPPGMTVPPPNLNMEVPEVEEGPVAYVEDDSALNEEGVRCLDTPPRLDRKS